MRLGGLRCTAKTARRRSEHEPASESYDNASCESFMKTLKREEIYANDYLDMDDLRNHIEDFIERYYNQKRRTK